jgi:hypothetical protein
MIDGNSTFYPLIDIPGSNMIKDPSWKNLFPIKYFWQVIIPSTKVRYPSFSTLFISYIRRDRWLVFIFFV